jgi:UDP-N-acetylmuramyl pentapeptide phosphotransferase/UDP-N-acetylglucosamine-1-phosphate transferase
MTLLLISFAAAFLATLVIVRSARSHAHFSGDTDQLGPQKFHARVVPRIGGIGIAFGIGAGMLYAATLPGSDQYTRNVLCMAGFIAFCSGLIEDFTKRVTPRQRMLGMILAAAIAMWLVDAEIDHTDIAGLDPLLGIAGVSMVLTLFAVAGVANSINIIDGFNGLASMCVAIMLAALAFVAYQVGDQVIFNCALIGLGAVLGFFAFNYPFGLVFLGDGGAYFMGFWVAELSILLVQRNDTVSPMFPLLLCIYPIFETVFTMYRRKIVRGHPMGQPDATHLHSLIYRRLMRWAVGKRDVSTLLRRNSMTSPYLWALCSLAALPAVRWWNDSHILQICIVLFCLGYLALYRAIVRFRTPRLLVRKGTPTVILKSAG